jgi:hypothetical protein
MIEDSEIRLGRGQSADVNMPGSYKTYCFAECRYGPKPTRLRYHIYMEQTEYKLLHTVSIIGHPYIVAAAVGF